MSEKKAETGADAGVELTREAVRRFIEGIEPGSLELAFREDPELTRLAIESSGVLATACFRAVRVFCEYLEALDPRERAEALERRIAGLDGSSVATAANAWSRLAMKVHGQRPDLAEAAFPALEAAFRETDFGKVREALTAVLDYFTVYMTRAIDLMMENPVVVANVVGVAPPLLNSLIRIISVTLEKVNLPPEILASALFNTMSALDAEEIGRMLTTASRMAIDIHAGDRILGGEEPRFRAVFADFMKRVMDNVDGEAATGAVVALAEDAEIAAGVLVEILARDPEMVVHSARMGAALEGVLARIAANSLAEAAAWPDELIVRVAAEVAAADTVEIGRAVDSAVTLALRVREADPDLQKKLLADALQEVNTERLELCLSAALKDLKEAALENQGIRQALEPEEVGRRINESLVRFNSGAASGPGAIRDYVTRLLDAVDTRELEKAAHTIADGMLDATLATRERAVMILKLLATKTWRFLKLSLKVFGSGLFS